MKKKTNGFETVGTEKMTDTELSKKLGHYQKMSSAWLLVGLIGVVGGTISFFAVQDAALKAILVTVLFFGGVCCALFLGGGAQKKLKALMHEQLGDFFHAELEKAFGPDIHTPEMRINEPFMKTLHLLDGQWEECEVENFHEGTHRGVHFSAANVRLDHVYERAIAHEGLETCRDKVFKGLVLRCETCVPAPSPIRVNARTESSPRGVVTDNEIFDRSFCVTAEPGQDAFYLLTPQFMELLETFGQHIEGHILGFQWKNSIFSLALETDFGFAAVASDVDLRDLDAARRSYTKSLQEMGETLDLLLKNATLFAGRD